MVLAELREFGILPAMPSRSTSATAGGTLRRRTTRDLRARRNRRGTIQTAPQPPANSSKAKHESGSPTQENEKAAERRDYEEAASLRDRIQTLQRPPPHRKFERNVLHTANHSQVLKRIQQKLDLRTLPNRMECFDISHISRTASPPCPITQPAPTKNYRRFKIKSFIGNDDFRAMEKSSAGATGDSPTRKRLELIVIDGGAGQVTAALKAFSPKASSHPTPASPKERDHHLL